jgi:hypothetical protein
MVGSGEERGADCTADRGLIVRAKEGYTMPISYTTVTANIGRVTWHQHVTWDGYLVVYCAWFTA